MERSSTVTDSAIANSSSTTRDQEITFLCSVTLILQNIPLLNLKIVWGCIVLKDITEGWISLENSLYQLRCGNQCATTCPYLALNRKQHRVTRLLIICSQQWLLDEKKNNLKLDASPLPFPLPFENSRFSSWIYERFSWMQSFFLWNMIFMNSSLKVSTKNK